jgi:hypothetical protein
MKAIARDIGVGHCNHLSLCTIYHQYRYTRVTLSRGLGTIDWNLNTTRLNDYDAMSMRNHYIMSTDLVAQNRKNEPTSQSVQACSNADNLQTLHDRLVEEWCYYTRSTNET